MNQQENSNKRKGTLNRDWGAFAEDRAAEYLRKQGYTILERNLKFNKIEIDIVAQKNQEIVFVEVKPGQATIRIPLKPWTERNVPKSQPAPTYICADLISCINTGLT